jgi:hypothetical protein
VNHTYPPDHRPPDPSWWAPLDALATDPAILADHPFLAREDFGLVGRVVRKGRPDITVYEHRWTHRFLNLDQHGTAYRFAPPRPGSASNGRYLAHRTPSDGVHQLRLWNLPWLKPGLEHLRPDVAPAPDRPPPPLDPADHRPGAVRPRRGHLRLV